MQHTRRDRARLGFTLVELLVVIAIIGILVALLLPAVNSAREAARRTQCMNQVRQIGLAMINLENAQKTFPSGGIHPWPILEWYAQGNQPFGPKRQGLSWAFQILPYLEENAIHNLGTTAQIQSSPVNIYFCPSRRAPIASDGRWLIDYVAMTAVPSRGQLGNQLFDALLTNTGGSTRACVSSYGFWGVPANGNVWGPELQSKQQLGTRYVGFWGVIVRSSFVKADLNDPAPRDLGYDPVTTVRRIKDGLSKTAVVAEKRINVRSQPGAAYDDRGWSDGWDLDTIALGLCQPVADSQLNVADRANAISSGSRHAAGMNVVYADGAVHFINFDIDVETWNRICHRSDGEMINELN